MIVRVQDLSYGYGREEALSHISFEVEKGDYVGIIGSNGSEMCIRDSDRIGERMN